MNTENFDGPKAIQPWGATMAVLGVGLTAASAQSTLVTFNSPVHLANGSSWFLEGDGGHTRLGNFRTSLQVFSGSSSSSGGGSVRHATLQLNGLQDVFLRATSQGVTPLNPGDVVGQGNGTVEWLGGNIMWQSNNGGPLFGPGNTGYLGFEFQNPDTGQTDYGWANITVDGATGLDINFWAYDNAGNAVVVAPEPSSAALTGLGALIAGAAGIRRYRRQQRAFKAS